MGWYREYLEDVAQMQQEKETNEMIAWFVVYVIFAGINIMFLSWGIDYWHNDEYLKSIGSYIGCLFFIVIPIATILKGGCVGVVGTLLIIAADIYIVIDPSILDLLKKENQQPKEVCCKTPPVQHKTNKSKVTISPYLQGVGDLSSNEDLSEFYYSIADKFKKNRMGLKGDSTQINAGNKLMSSLYDFLGTSAKKGLLNVDSMKIIIQNATIVSDYRKKKAVQELNLGIDKINSLDE